MRLPIAALTLLAALTAPAMAATLSPAFEVTITLSDAAAQKLSESGETITISAYFGGEPKPDVQVDDPQIMLASEDKELPAAGTLSFAPETLDAEGLAKVIEPRLNINVYTSRKKFEDNLLDCGFFDDVITAIPRDKPITISCKLIGE
jgi:hypothetical protein